MSGLRSCSAPYQTAPSNLQLLILYNWDGYTSLQSGCSDYAIIRIGRQFLNSENCLGLRLDQDFKKCHTLCKRQDIMTKYLLFTEVHGKNTKQFAKVKVCLYFANYFLFVYLSLLFPPSCGPIRVLLTEKYQTIK